VAVPGCARDEHRAGDAVAAGPVLHDEGLKIDEYCSASSRAVWSALVPEAVITMILTGRFG